MFPAPEAVVKIWVGRGGSGGEEMGGAGDLVVSGNGVLARQGVLNDKGGTQRS